VAANHNSILWGCALFVGMPSNSIVHQSGQTESIARPSHPRLLVVGFTPLVCIDPQPSRLSYLITPAGFRSTRPGNMILLCRLDISLPTLSGPVSWCWMEVLSSICPVRSAKFKVLSHPAVAEASAQTPMSDFTSALPVKRMVLTASAVRTHATAMLKTESAKFKIIGAI